jgi:hypothetical protein
MLDLSNETVYLIGLIIASLMIVSLIVLLWKYENREIDLVSLVNEQTLLIRDLDTEAEKQHRLHESLMRHRANLIKLLGESNIRRFKQGIKLQQQLETIRNMTQSIEVLNDQVDDRNIALAKVMLGATVIAKYGEHSLHEPEDTDEMLKSGTFVVDTDDDVDIPISYDYHEQDQA